MRRGEGKQEMLTMPNSDKALCIQHIVGHLGWTVKQKVQEDGSRGHESS